MTRSIIYPQDNGSVVHVMPAHDCGIPFEEIARKDVPAGVPYLFVNDADLPDLEFFDAWEADFSSPDGYGIGAEAWFAEQAAKEQA